MGFCLVILNSRAIRRWSYFS